MSSSPTGPLLSPASSRQSHARVPSPIRDTFERFCNHVGRARSSSSGSARSFDGPTSNWIVNMGSAAGSVGGVKVTYKSNRPHGGFGNLLVNIGTQAGSVGGSHHLRQGSGNDRQHRESDERELDGQSYKSLDTNQSQESFYSTSDTPASSSTSAVAPRRGSAASDESYPGARLFVRQLSAYLAQDESDRESLFICEHPKAVENDFTGADGPNILSNHDEALLQDLGFFDFGKEHSVGHRSSELPPIENMVDIAAYTRDADTPALRMKALLDTGNMGPNMMASSLAKLTGHPIEHLPDGFSFLPVVGNGEQLVPEGIVRVRWYFSERFSQAKSYDILFLVVPDAVPFDVVLGFKFLQAEHIFTMPSLFAMTGGHFVHSGSEAERRRAEEAARRRREEQARRRREEEARKRERERERRRAAR